MKKIRFGIIGCSSVAERNTIPAILKAKNAELAFIGSRSQEKAKKFAKKFSCKNYGSYEEALERKDIDAVYISLPISLQEKIAINSAKAEKHILCEKSITTSYKSAEKIVRECKKSNLMILEGFSFVYHPQQKRVLDLIRNKKIGEIFSFSGKYGFVLPYSKNDFRFKKILGGGVLNDVGCYLIKASRMIFQTNPISINCELHSDKKGGVDLKGSIHMIFPKNKISVSLFSYLDIFQSKYELWGSNGTISLDRAFNVKNNMETSILVTTKNKTKRIKIQPVDQSEKMIVDFCNNITEFNKKTIFGKELLNQALILEKARISNKKKEMITI